jgi:hypothetical protein
VVVPVALVPVVAAEPAVLVLAAIAAIVVVAVDRTWTSR